MQNISVLFVCLGNICRSPVAEGLLRKMSADTGLALVADSAGTGDWHAGQRPHLKSQAVALRNGFDISALEARQIEAEDWTRYTHIVALDRANLNDLKGMRPENATAQLLLLMQHAETDDEDVLDPYGMADEAFDRMYAQIDAGVTGLLKTLAP